MRELDVTRTEIHVAQPSVEKELARILRDPLWTTSLAIRALLGGVATLEQQRSAAHGILTAHGVMCELPESVLDGLGHSAAAAIATFEAEEKKNAA